MKIGAVCEQTGLTDRTVRYYIDEELLVPSFTKNYLGRKTFDFTEDDVRMLRDVAILRKYGFSIPEIRAILKEPQQSVKVIEDIQKKKQETIQKEQKLLSILLTLEPGRAYTVSELARALDTPVLEKTELPEEPLEGCLMVFCKLHFWWLCAPMLCFVVFGIPFVLYDWAQTLIHRKFYSYMADYAVMALGWLAPVVGAAAMIFLEAKRGRMDPNVRRALMILLCVCYTIFGTMGIVVASIGTSMAPVYSETEDPADYLILGKLESEIMGAKLENLFPKQIPEYAMGQSGYPSPDATRYYNFVEVRWGKRFDLIAQWMLTKEDLKHEKQRIMSAFSDADFTQAQFGDWVLWSMSESDPEKCLQNPDLYAEEAEYSFLFFAYHERSGVVRYVAAYGYEVYDEPAFLSLDWE